MINVTLSICFCFVFGSFAVREPNVKIVVKVLGAVCFLSFADRKKTSKCCHGCHLWCCQSTKTLVILSVLIADFVDIYEGTVLLEPVTLKFTISSKTKTYFQKSCLTNTFDKA